ncbi:MAG TPA: hypothetical protein VH913_13925 [Hyphomicrobiaceae bacterium]|jgi:hypothetical protein
MSVARLLFSGLLVASGLILGAFTLHNRFAPTWEVQATGPRERDGELFAAVQAGDRPRAAASAFGDWTPQLVRAKPEAETDVGSAAKVTKRLGKKLAEKRPKKEKDNPEEPQTVFPWLWNLLANNNGK